MTRLARDDGGATIQAVRPATTQKLTVSGSSVASAAVGARLIRIVATGDIHYNLNSAADASDVFLPAGTIEYISTYSADVLHVIGSASVYISSAS